MLGNWPGEELPTSLANLSFNTSSELDSTSLIFSSSELSSGYDFSGVPITIESKKNIIRPSFQQIYSENNTILVSPGEDISFPLLYNTSDDQNSLSGLTLNVHYNSTLLSPSGENNGVTDQITASIYSTNVVIDDIDDLDNNSSTDKIIQLAWGDMLNQWPGEELPTSLATLSFKTPSYAKDPLTGQRVVTTLGYSASETASGYDFIGEATTLESQIFNLDVDGDGKVKALSDGIMIIRKLVGPAFEGDALTAKAISPDATRDTDEIHEYIQGGIDSGILDVDQNGETKALSDGLMIIRKLVGPAFEGDALTAKAISPNATRDTDEIHAYIESLIIVDPIA